MGWFLKDYGEGSIEDLQFSGRIVVPCTELKTLEWARWDQEMERLEPVKSRVWPNKLSFVSPLHCVPISCYVCSNALSWLIKSLCGLLYSSYNLPFIIMLVLIAFLLQ